MSQLTFPSSRKKHLNNKNLQPSHRNHQPTLKHTKIENPLLRAPDGAEISILARAEVLLLARESGDLAGELEDGFLDAAELVGARAGFLREGGLFFVFHLRGEEGC